MGVERRDFHAGEALQVTGETTNERYESAERGLSAFAQNAVSKFTVYGAAVLAVFSLVKAHADSKEKIEATPVKIEEVTSPYITSPEDFAALQSKQKLATPVKPEQLSEQKTSIEKQR